MERLGPVPTPALRIAAFSAAFFVIVSLTIALTRYGGGLALVWFGSAVAAVMLVGLPRGWWLRGLAVIMAVSALATSLFGFGPHMAAPLALINGFEAWLVARLLLAVRPQRDWLDSVAGLAALVGVGVIASGLGAVLGGLAASTAAPGSWQQLAADWWAAHALGALIGFPLTYLAAAIGREVASGRWTARRALELAGHLSTIALVASQSIGQSALPLLFVPVVPLLLAAFRCGREGAVFGTLIIGAIAAFSFEQPGSMGATLALAPPQHVLFVQFYVAVLLMLALPTSVALKQHKLLLAELEERKALELLVADHSDDALLNLDEDGLVRYASPASRRLSGEETLLGRPLAIFFEPLDEGLVREALARAAAAPGETHAIERPVLRGDEQLWLQAKIRAVAPSLGPGDRPGALQGFAVTIRDVTARKRTELEAIQAAETDPLTGLPNRRALLGQLERCLTHAEQRPFALAILDLDHFKRINDTHGHPTGDMVLHEVAAVMRRMSSPSRYFARIGGEEFALIGRLGGLERTASLCEQLRAEIAGLPLAAPSGDPLHVTVSIGVALVGERIGAGPALQAADALLYQAKHGGRNRVATAASPADPVPVLALAHRHAA